MFNPVLILPLSCLVDFILGINPIELLGIFTGYVLKVITFDPIIEITIDYSLEVSLITVKHLVPCIVLPQDLF